MGSTEVTLHRNIKDETGKLYGRLTVLGYAYRHPRGGYAMWRCLCDCGQEIVTYGQLLRNGRTKSCGCLKREAKTHGQGRKGHQSMEYGLLRSVRRRAREKNLEMSLTVDDIHIPEFCPALGIRLETNPRNPDNVIRPSAPTLDRFNLDRGYIQDNSRVISFRANELKRNATAEELLKVAGYCMDLPPNLLGWTEWDADSHWASSWADLK